MTLFILSYPTHSPILTLARFRKARQKRIYSNLRQFILWKVQIVLVLKFLSGKELKLIVDGTIVPVANTNRARTQKIRRFSGRVFLYSVHYGKRVQFEELYYGVVYDLWFTSGSMHEARAYRVRKAKSARLRIQGCRSCEGM